jgi:hypothetical protein
MSLWMKYKLKYTVLLIDWAPRHEDVCGRDGRAPHILGMWAMNLESCRYNQWRTQEFYSGGGVNKFSWGQRERGSGGSGPLVRGSGGSCNLVKEISFHIVKFS